MSAPPGSAALRPPLRGPSALGGDARRFATLTYTLAALDFKVRFFGSVLGYLWQLIRPLLLFGILYVIFDRVVRFNEGVRHFPAILLVGVVLFGFFSDATSNAVTSVLDRENLVRKVRFPRLVVPASVVLTAAFNLSLNLVAVGVFLVAMGVEPRASWLLLPPLVLALALLTAGVAMLVSALYVRFRDVKPIWEVLLQVLFYGAPILYAIEVVPSVTLQRVLMLNPIGALLQQARHWLIDPSAPSAAEAIGGGARLLVPAAIVVGLFALGLWVFSREAPRIAEEL